MFQISCRSYNIYILHYIPVFYSLIWSLSRSSCKVTVIRTRIKFTQQLWIVLKVNHVDIHFLPIMHSFYILFVRSEYRQENLCGIWSPSCCTRYVSSLIDSFECSSVSWGITCNKLWVTFVSFMMAINQLLLWYWIQMKYLHCS